MALLCCPLDMHCSFVLLQVGRCVYTCWLFIFVLILDNSWSFRVSVEKLFTLQTWQDVTLGHSKGKVWKDGTNHSQIQSSLYWLAEFSSHSETQNPYQTIACRNKNRHKQNDGNLMKPTPIVTGQTSSVVLRTQPQGWLQWGCHYETTHSWACTILGNYSDVRPQLLCF